MPYTPDARGAVASLRPACPNVTAFTLLLHGPNASMILAPIEPARVLARMAFRQ